MCGVILIWKSWLVEVEGVVAVVAEAVEMGAMQLTLVRRLQPLCPEAVVCVVPVAVGAVVADDVKERPTILKKHHDAGRMHSARCCTDLLWSGACASDRARVGKQCAPCEDGLHVPPPDRVILLAQRSARNPVCGCTCWACGSVRVTVYGAEVSGQTNGQQDDAGE